MNSASVFLHFARPLHEGARTASSSRSVRRSPEGEGGPVRRGPGGEGGSMGDERETDKTNPTEKRQCFQTSGFSCSRASRQNPPIRDARAISAERSRSAPAWPPRRFDKTKPTRKAVQRQCLQVFPDATRAIRARRPRVQDGARAEARRLVTA